MDRREAILKAADELGLREATRRVIEVSSRFLANFDDDEKELIAKAEVAGQRGKWTPEQKLLVKVLRGWQDAEMRTARLAEKGDRSMPQVVTTRQRKQMVQIDEEEWSTRICSCGASVRWTGFDMEEMIAWTERHGPHNEIPGVMLPDGRVTR